MLTDKALEHFEKFFLERQKKFDFYNANNFALNEFVTFHSYIDFFDSVGIYILTIPSLRIFNKWTYRVFCHDLSDYTPQVAYLYTDRKQATIKAIEKANKIYNLKQNSNGNK